MALGGSIYALWPKPIEVEIGEVSRGPMFVSIDEDGMTRIRERYTVSSPVAGQLGRIKLDPGDAIQAGETLLASIQPADPSMLDARQVAESEARVAAAKVVIERAKVRREQARIARELADSHIVRAEQLWEQDSISRREYDDALAAARGRGEELRAATFDEEIAKFELQQAEAALLRVKPSSAATLQSQFEIRAPIDGHVLRVLQESATVVTPGTPLLEVGNRADLEIVIDVLSTDAVKIKPGDEVLLEHWGGDRSLAAIVRTIEPAAFTKISALGVEEQRVNIIADFQAGQAEVASLGDGFRVEARIVIWRDAKALRVPSSALFRGGKEWFAYVAESGTARRRPVQIGQRNETESEVLTGLSAGDSVILYPSDLVGDGVRLTKRIR
jgi:HlyD family secretion protein